MLYALLEFQSGHATTIRVTAQGNTFSIADNGRGHPIDKSVDGTSYLKFIYAHFDYPFESGRSAVTDRRNGATDVRRNGATNSS